MTRARAVQTGVLYALFAGVAIATNLLAQRGTAFVWRSLALREELEVYAALIVGTGAGLLVKYVLDKRFIFGFKATSVAHDLATFIFYSLMGIATTAIFWGVELLFELAGEAPGARYVGGFIGLSIGYTVKYFLDRRFVFRTGGEEDATDTT